jgi:glycosyltransferase involved in cell wall biosynthesis
MNTITVVTINYNNKLGLEKTFLSVCNQTNKNFEYIVIDGGSTDGSEQLLEEYKNKISYFVSESDNGIYHAMNKGIKVATGDFLIFMNSGDVFYNETIIDTIGNELNETDAIVYGDALLKNELTGYQNTKIHPEKLSFKYFYKETICQQACIIKKSLFDTVSYFNEDHKIVSDWEFLIVAIFINNVSVRKIPFVLAVFDCEGISSNQSMRIIASTEREQVLDRYFSLFKEDYKLLMAHSSNRSQQLLQIEKSLLWRKFVSVIFKIILIILPKTK